MPEISQFYGIVITMYFGDYSPPHFHDRYGDDKAEYDIRTLELLAGNLPKRAHLLAVEWALEHRDELLNNWERATSLSPLETIKPLD